MLLLLLRSRGDTVVAAAMAEREERRFAEVSRDSIRLMAESAGVELGDEVAALLAEDVCYRLREAAQVQSSSTRRHQPAALSLTVMRRLFLRRAEQLSVYETRQEEEADGGGREPSAALEQRGGERAAAL